MSPRNELIKARPFLKWVGGKAQLLSQFEEYYPKDFNNYFEPFLGGGAVFFDLSPVTAHLNDVNTTLIAAYKNLKNKPNEIVRILKRLDAQYKKGNAEEQSALFYRVREKFNNLPISEIEKTAYLIFLNKTCFNGMYRENSSGGFNSPFGKYKKPPILDQENLFEVSKILKKVKLTALPFEKSLKNAIKNDFIYFDPPYYPLSKTSNFTSYHKDSFTESDQLKLRNIFLDLDKRGCFVMLSNSCTGFIKDIYEGFRQEIVLANRSINCKASGRGKIKELLIMNYE